jgi:iron complex outermembrane receptor protein
MAYTPKMNRIAGACALLFCINAQSFAQSETQLSPVVVTGEKGTGYVAKGAMIGGPGGTEEVELKDVPTSINVITKDMLDDRQVRGVSEAVQTDASAGDYYATIGYYENLFIRGFQLDHATSYRINGLNVSGEQNFALENKDRVEILKGVGALQIGASSPGGIINFVTKRPKDVSSATIGTGERGTQYIAADYGTFLNKEKSLGIRINAAHENIKPFVKGAEGKREFFSIAADLKVSSKTLVQFDIEHQKKSQKPVYGVTLLGNSVIPQIPADIMLNRYSWTEPTTINSLNTTLKIDHEINNDLRSFTHLSYSNSKINDRSAYPFGCAGEASAVFCLGNGTSNGLTTQPGDFNVYDYRLNDIRRNHQVQTGLTGKIDINGIRNEWIAGISYFNRSIYKGSSVYNDSTVYDDDWNVVSRGYWIDNIYNLNSSNVSGPATGSPGSPHKILDHKQFGFFGHNKIHLSESIKLFIGARFISMREQTYKLKTDGLGSNLYKQRDKTYVLPQTGLTYELSKANTIYASYSEGLELGTVPIIDSFKNGDDILPPKTTQQYEIGNKYSPNPNLFATIAVFQAKRVNEISVRPEPPAVGSPPKYDLVQDGNLINTGIEANLGLKISNRLDLITSLMYLEAKQTGTESGGQAIGIPNWKSVVFADYKVPQVENLSLLGGWTYISSKSVKLDGSMKVPGYHKFDAGLKYIDRVGKSKATYRVNVENIFNSFYWRDVSQTYGSNTLYPGIPRIFRATATFDF